MSETSIHDACQSGDEEAVVAWIAADPSCVDRDDAHAWRPIFHASLWQHERIVRLLIDAGADVCAHEGYALHYAGEVPDNKTIVTLLIQNGALNAHVRPANDLARQFLAAIFLANLPRVQSLLTKHPHLVNEVDGRGDQPIHHAARNGDTEIVSCLLQFGAAVNATNPRGHTVLYCAGGHGHLETVRLLLANGVNIHAPLLSDGTTFEHWLMQYPTDLRFKPITSALKQYLADSSGNS